MIYPIVLMVVCCGVVTGLMAFVVPKLIGLLRIVKRFAFYHRYFDRLQ